MGGLSCVVEMEGAERGGCDPRGSVSRVEVAVTAAVVEPAIAERRWLDRSDRDECLAGANWSCQHDPRPPTLTQSLTTPPNASRHGKLRTPRPKAQALCPPGFYKPPPAEGRSDEVGLEPTIQSRPRDDAGRAVPT